MIFTNVIKPTHLCNLAYTYCYNDDVREPIMRDETLERTIAETFSYVRDHAPQRLVSFIWHGGEPMLPGLDFYRRAVALQAQYADGMPYSNSLQTNGVLIRDDWIDFLLEHRFTVSISIDGPQSLHDRFRVDHKGRGTHTRVMEAITRVKKAGIPLGVCLVISRANIAHADEIFQFLADHELPFNIIPLNRSGAARDNFLDVGLDADEYADAWIALYDKWFESDKSYVYCSDFVFKTRAIASGGPADCVGLSRCADTNIAVDPVGDIFPCATLSGSEDTRYGNILDAPLAEIMAATVAEGFRNRRVDPQCATCNWQHVCHGGCPARSYKFHGNFHERDYYCPSLFRIYEHIAAKLDAHALPRGVPQPVEVKEEGAVYA